MDEMIKIIKPTGEDSYKVITAFKVNETDFVVLDSKLKDPNGNIITFVAQIDGEELKDIEGETWDLVRNALITIVKGIDSDYKHKVNFEFIKVGNEYKASENIGHTLGLKDAHIASINNQYKDFSSNIAEDIPTKEEIIPEQSVMDLQPEVASESEIQSIEQSSPLDQSIDNANTANIDVATIVEAANQPEQISSTEEVINFNEPIIESNEPSISEKTSANINSKSVIPTNEETVLEQPVVDMRSEDMPTEEDNQETQEVQENSLDSLNYVEEFEKIRKDFNALIDKCENEIREKQQMVDAQLKVANIAFDNAQNVMNTPQDSDSEIINVEEYKPQADPILQKVA